MSKLAATFEATGGWSLSPVLLVKCPFKDALNSRNTIVVGEEIKFREPLTPRSAPQAEAIIKSERRVSTKGARSSGVFSLELASRTHQASERTTFLPPRLLTVRDSTAAAFQAHLVHGVSRPSGVYWSGVGIVWRSDPAVGPALHSHLYHEGRQLIPVHRSVVVNVHLFAVFR